MQILLTAKYKNDRIQIVAAGVTNTASKTNCFAIGNMERYRSGHNEAVLKTVCPKGRMGSNPILSVGDSFSDEYSRIWKHSFNYWTASIIGQLQLLDSFFGEVPKRLKGLPWKGSRSLIAARGFKSLLLRQLLPNAITVENAP